MAVTPEVVEGARKLRSGAVATLLQDQAPSVYRLAYALSGRWDVGRGIARFVLNRSVRVMPKWKPDDDPGNWFHRFTIMTSRRSAKHRAEPAKDVLVQQSASPGDAPYVAFIAALRQLDNQQREAFLLRHGEKLNARYMALAMDCSTEAADNHLRAAEQALRLVAAGSFEPMTRKLEDAYAHLTPEKDQLLPSVNQVVFRRVRLRRAMRFVVIVIELAAIAGILWAGWWVYQSLRT